MARRNSGRAWPQSARVPSGTDPLEMISLLSDVCSRSTRTIQDPMRIAAIMAAAADDDSDVLGRLRSRRRQGGIRENRIVRRLAICDTYTHHGLLSCLERLNEERNGSKEARGSESTTQKADFDLFRFSFAPARLPCLVLLLLCARLDSVACLPFFASPPKRASPPPSTRDFATYSFQGPTLPPSPSRTP